MQKRLECLEKNVWDPTKCAGEITKHLKVLLMI